MFKRFFAFLDTFKCERCGHEVVAKGKEIVTGCACGEYVNTKVKEIIDKSGVK